VLKISVYESGYFMRDLDPDANFQEAQKLYRSECRF
jgi:hypothetical protein